MRTIHNAKRPSYAVLVLPRRLAHVTMQRFHNYPGLATHYGYQKLYTVLSQKFFWYGMYEDAKRYVQKCPLCPLLKPDRRQKIPFIRQPRILTRPGQLVHIDCVTGLPRTSAGNTIILTMVEAYSRYVVLTPLKTKTTAAVAKAFITQYCAFFGTPASLHADRGEAATPLISALLALNGGDLSRTPSYSPYSNAVVERLHASLNILLRANSLSDYAKKNWDEFLPYVMQILNNTPHSALVNYTPQEIMCGHTANTSTSPFISTNHKEVKQDEYLRFVQLAARLKWRVIHDAQMERRRKQNNPNAQIYKFQEGDLCCLKDEALKGKGHNKLSLFAKGPYVILKLYNVMAYITPFQFKTDPKFTSNKKETPLLFNPKCTLAVGLRKLIPYRADPKHVLQICSNRELRRFLKVMRVGDPTTDNSLTDDLLPSDYRQQLLSEVDREIAEEDSQSFMTDGPLSATHPRSRGSHSSETSTDNPPKLKRRDFSIFPARYHPNVDPEGQGSQLDPVRVRMDYALPQNEQRGQYEKEIENQPPFGRSFGAAPTPGSAQLPTSVAPSSFVLPPEEREEKEVPLVCPVIQRRSPLKEVPDNQSSVRSVATVQSSKSSKQRHRRTKHLKSVGSHKSPDVSAPSVVTSPTVVGASQVRAGSQVSSQVSKARPDPNDLTGDKKSSIVSDAKQVQLRGTGVSSAPPSIAGEPRPPLSSELPKARPPVVEPSQVESQSSYLDPYKVVPFDDTVERTRQWIQDIDQTSDLSVPVPIAKSHLSWMSENEIAERLALSATGSNESLGVMTPLRSELTHASQGTPKAPLSQVTLTPSMSASQVRPVPLSRPRPLHDPPRSTTRSTSSKPTVSHKEPQRQPLRRPISERSSTQASSAQAEAAPSRRGRMTLAQHSKKLKSEGSRFVKQFIDPKAPATTRAKTVYQPKGPK